MLALFLLLAAAAPPADVISGTAIAGDGDSLTIGEEHVRLFGIDAPEFDQVCDKAGEQWACGKTAADELARLVTGRRVRCAKTGEDGYGRTLARCTVSGVDVNQAMVSAGYAVAFRKYSTDYVAAEDAAKAARRGMWAGTFIMPWEFRAEGRGEIPGASSRQTSRPRAAASNRSGSCDIKGNRSRRGEWIYHLPGMPYYDQAVPEEIFCSEAAAVAAGYRRAIVR